MRVDRIVLDTNVLISAFLQPLGPSGLALDRVLAGDVGLALSEPLFVELTTRLLRPKFDRYATRARRGDYFGKLRELGRFVPIRGLRLGCRDPDDDKVIETALVGGAQALATGDQDLLTMAPPPGLLIVTPRGFLDLVGA